MAICAFSIGARFPNDAVISGTDGSLKVVALKTGLGLQNGPTAVLFKTFCLVLDRI